MAALDWVFLGVLAFSLLLGALRGLVYEVLSVLSWIAAFVAAQWLAPAVGAWLPMGSTGEPLRYAAGFALVFLGVVFTGGVFAWGMRKLVEAVGLRPVDRVLGAAFGMLRGAVLLLALAVVVNMTPLHKQQWWMESKGADVATSTLRKLKPVLPDEFGEYLPV